MPTMMNRKTRATRMIGAMGTSAFSGFAAAARACASAGSSVSWAMMASRPERDSALEAAGAEGRQDLVLDDLRRQGVGQHRLEPIADLDPHARSLGATISRAPVSCSLLPMPQARPRR
jgi:hypothetical protein